MGPLTPMGEPWGPGCLRLGLSTLRRRQRVWGDGDVAVAGVQYETAGVPEVGTASQTEQRVHLVCELTSHQLSTAQQETGSNRAQRMGRVNQ